MRRQLRSSRSWAPRTPCCRTPTRSGSTTSTARTAGELWLAESSQYSPLIGQRGRAEHHQRRGPGHRGQTLRGPHQQGRHPRAHGDHAEGKKKYFVFLKVFSFKKYLVAGADGGAAHRQGEHERAGLRYSQRGGAALRADGHRWGGTTSKTVQCE